MSTHADSKPWTVPALAEAKRNGQKLVMLTAYDAGFARAFDANGVDLILIGDSLGMVVQGHDSTLPVTTDDMVYHTACVARVLTRALLIADLPFGADATPERAFEASLRLLQAGAEMVKIEGAGFKLDVIRYLVDREIPVCSHLGLTPQSVLHDFLGLDSGHRRPKFVKDFLAEGGSVAGAVRAYADAVRDGSFPDAEHAYAS